MSGTGPSRATGTRSGASVSTQLRTALSTGASRQAVAEAAVAILPPLVSADGAAVFLRRDDGSLELAAHHATHSARYLLALAAGRLIRLPPQSDAPASRVARGRLAEIWDTDAGGRLETYPLISDGQVLGALCLLRAPGDGTTGGPPAEAPAAEVAAALADVAEREQASELVDDVWRSRSPRSIPWMPRLDIACCLVRGDVDRGSWCEVAQTGPDTAVVGVGSTGDVNAVALAAAAARHALSASSALTDDPAELLAIVTEFAEAHLGLSGEASCCVVRLNAATGRMDWAGTQGLRPMVVSGSAVVPVSDEAGATTQLAAEDVLVVRGLRPTAADVTPDENAVVDAVRVMAGGSLPEGCDALAADVRLNGGQRRDQAVVAIRMSPPRPMLTAMGASASVPLARSYTRRELAHLGVRSQTLVRNAELVTSELVSNVVRHVGGQFDLRWQRLGDLVRVEVTDLGDPQNLRVPETEVLAESGRGLLIIESLSTSWGVNNADGGKLVWAELAIPPEDETPDGSPQD